MPDKNKQPPTKSSVEARDLAAKVEQGLEKGSLNQAKRAFTQNWRDAVPELPLRFSTILVRYNKTAVLEALRLRKKSEGKGPQLRLEWSEEGRVQVVMARGRKLHIGDLPASDVELIQQLGDKAKRLYKPRLLQVKRGDNGDIDYVAIELVRAEARDHNNQDFEHAPIAFQEALEQITAEADDGKDLEY